MQAGIIDKFMPIDASNVALWCDKHKGPARSATRRRRRQEAPRLSQVRRGSMTTATRPRLKVRFDEEIRPALKDELGLDNIMQVPRLVKIVLNSGVGTRHAAGVAPRGRPARPRADHRPEAGRDAREEVDRELQAPRGTAHRREGDAARRPRLGVPRPADQPRDPAHPRLPRTVAQVLRRTRQLHVRHQRPVDLPRDRLRQDRRAAWLRHHDRHHRRERRAGPRVPRAYGFPFRQENK